MRLLKRKNNEFDELIIDMNRRSLVLTKLNRTSIKKPGKLVLQQNYSSFKNIISLISESEFSVTDNPLAYLLLSTDNQAADVPSYTSDEN